MDQKIIIKPLKKSEINSLSLMITAIFDEFIGCDYSEEGKATFKDNITPKNILDRLAVNRFYTAKKGTAIIGALEIRNNDHIALFFVDKKYHKKGIGKMLFNNYLNELNKMDTKIETITVNSSIYAVKIYERLGFKKTGELQEKNGIKFIPMAYLNICR